MERFVRLIAPRNRIDFLFKVVFFLILCGVMNHTRAVLTYGWADSKGFLYNLNAATFTALPMTLLALFLIQHLNNLQRKLYLQATTDLLTQLPNRRWFLDQHPDFLTGGQTLVLLDLDYFKTVNDTYGHDIGDDCLVAMANHMRANLPEGVKSARLGGEEFGILFETEPLDVVQDAVTAICKGVDVAINAREVITITSSAGIVTVEGKVAMRRAFQLADAALYRAKEAGRVQYAMGHLDDAPVSQTKRTPKSNMTAQPFSGSL